MSHQMTPPTPSERLESHRRDIGSCELDRIITDGNEMETTETIVKTPTPSEADKRTCDQCKHFQMMRPPNASEHDRRFEGWCRMNWIGTGKKLLRCAGDDFEAIAAIEKVEG